MEATAFGGVKWLQCEIAPCLSKSEAISNKQQSFRVPDLFKREVAFDATKRLIINRNPAPERRVRIVV